MASQTQNKPLSWTRVLIYLGAGVGLFRVILKVLALRKIWNRRKNMLLKLPQVKSKTKNKHQSVIFGDYNQMLPKDMPFTQDNLSRHSLSVNQQIYDSTDEGLIVKWYINPDLPGPPMHSIQVKDIKLVRELLSSKMLPKIQKSLAYEFSRPLIGDGVLATSGPKWHKQRVIIEQGFLPNIMKKQFTQVVKTANELVDRINLLGDSNFVSSDVTGIDVAEEMLKTTIDVLGRVAFSYDFGSLKAKTTADAPLYNSFDTILSNITKRVRNPFLQLAKNVPFLEINVETNKALAHLNSTVDGLIKDRKAKNVDTINDLLDVMLHHADPETNQKLTDTEIIDDIKTLLFAGHDTTAAALTWFIYLIAKQPEIGEKILEELNSKWGGIITIDNMERSDYLNACTLELLRMYPSAGFGKRTKEDIQLGKYLIPEGSDLTILPVLIQRNEDYYENAKEFIPERWLKEESKEQLGFQARLAKETLKNPFLPFSLGKRNCVGRPLALIEIRVVLLRLLQEFQFRLPSKPHPDFQEMPWMGLTAFPNHVHVEFEPKN